MRSAIVLALTSACIPEPTGLPQTWPPQLGLTVEAVTAGDLDGDGQPEILVFSTGDEHQAGIYAIEGHNDLELGSSPVRSFTTFVPMAYTKPMAAAQGLGTDGMPLVFTSYIDVSHYIVVDLLTNQFYDNGSVTTDLPVGNTLLWVRPVRFPGNKVRMMVGNGSLIEHLADDGSDLKMLPPPSGAAWPTATLATTYSTGSDAWTIAVATPTDLWRAPIPTSSAQFTWTSARSGTAWAGQTALDLDADGRDDIAGIDLATHSVCAVDAMKGGTPPCLALGTTSPGTEISIVIAHVAGVPTAPDLVITQSIADVTAVSVIADFAFTGDTLTGTAMAMPPLSIAHARAVVVNFGIGTPEAVLLFGSTGAVACAVGAGC